MPTCDGGTSTQLALATRTISPELMFVLCSLRTVSSLLKSTRILRDCRDHVLRDGCDQCGNAASPQNAPAGMPPYEPSHSRPSGESLGPPDSAAQMQTLLRTEPSSAGPCDSLLANEWERPMTRSMVRRQLLRICLPGGLPKGSNLKT